MFTLWYRDIFACGVCSCLLTVLLGGQIGLFGGVSLIAIDNGILGGFGQGQVCATRFGVQGAITRYLFYVLVTGAKESGASFLVIVFGNVCENNFDPFTLYGRSILCGGVSFLYRNERRGVFAQVFGVFLGTCVISFASVGCTS